MVSKFSNTHKFAPLLFLVVFTLIGILLYYIANADTEIKQSEAASAARVSLNQTIELGGNGLASPKIANIDNAGKIEFIVPIWGLNYTNGKIAVYGLDNQNRLIMKPGWPKTYAVTVSAAPAVGNIDNAGRMEIVGGPGNSIYIYNYDGTNFGTSSQWPKTCALKRSPTLADLDNNGDLEIIASCANLLYVWNHDGSLFNSNWPKRTAGTNKEFNSPTIADINNDGDLDILVGTYTFSTDGVNHELFAWESNGSLISGFPFITDNSIFETQIVSDIDHDGVKEIIFSTNPSVATTNHKLHMLNSSTGEQKNGWPQTVYYTGQSAPSVGNIDDDPNLEIFIGGYRATGENAGRLYAFYADGSPIPNLNAMILNSSANVKTSPILVDIDNDNKTEIFIKTNKKVYGLYSNGSNIAGYPFSFDESDENGGATPYLGNLDTDPKSEAVFINFQGQLTVKDNIGTSFNPHWSMYKANNQNTGSR